MAGCLEARGDVCHLCFARCAVKDETEWKWEAKGVKKKKRKVAETEIKGKVNWCHLTLEKRKRLISVTGI